ncbi:hypothetical protein M3Y94_00965500 [Aphelenchoides besseyi]|nr:hypothetical protein M3Y94_00965500 [Aphelenchoides besseyi]KAI6224672.1 hypothetical protein M3Y95_00777400 [Aphelenchoides besseyi]
MENKPMYADFYKHWSPCKNATRSFDNCMIEIEYHQLLSLVGAIFLFFASFTILLIACSFCSSTSSGCMHCGAKTNQKKSKHSAKSQRPTQRTVVAARPSSVRAETTEDTDVPSVRVSARTNRPFAQSRR